MSIPIPLESRICCGSILSLVQILFSFLLNSLSYITIPKTKGNKIGTKDKIEPQHIFTRGKTEEKLICVLEKKNLSSRYKLCYSQQSIATDLTISIHHIDQTMFQTKSDVQVQGSYEQDALMKKSLIVFKNAFSAAECDTNTEGTMASCEYQVNNNNRLQTLFYQTVSSKVYLIIIVLFTLHQAISVSFDRTPSLFAKGLLL